MNPIVLRNLLAASPPSSGMTACRVFLAYIDAVDFDDPRTLVRAEAAYRAALSELREHAELLEPFRGGAS